MEELGSVFSFRLWFKKAAMQCNGRSEQTCERGRAGCEFRARPHKRCQISRHCRLPQVARAHLLSHMLPSASGFVPSSPFRAPALVTAGLLEPTARMSSAGASTGGSATGSATGTGSGKQDFFLSPGAGTGKHPMNLRRSSSGADASATIKRGLSGESPMSKNRTSMRFVMNHDGLAMFSDTTGRYMVDDESNRRGSAASEHYAHGTGTPKAKNGNGGMITCVDSEQMFRAFKLDPRTEIYFDIAPSLTRTRSILSPHPAVDASARFSGYFTTASTSSYLSSSRGPATPPRMPHPSAAAAVEAGSPSAPFRFAALALGEPAMQSSSHGTSERARLMASAGSFDALSQLAGSHHRATSDAPWSMMNQLPIASGALPIGVAKALTRYTSVTEALRPGSFAADGNLLPSALPSDDALVQPLLTVAASQANSDKAPASTAASMMSPATVQAANASRPPIPSTTKASTLKSPPSAKRETASAAAAAACRGIEYDDRAAGSEYFTVDSRRSARIASIETYQAESAAAARLEGLVDACMESSAGAGSGAGMGTFEPSTCIVRVRGRLTRAAPQKEKDKDRAKAPAAMSSSSVAPHSVKTKARGAGAKYADTRREHILAAAATEGVPFELDETTINTRQFDAIIRRRSQRAEFDEYRRRIRDRGFLHESRSKHALRRVRGERGKFLSIEELAALEHAQMVASAALALQQQEQQEPRRKKQKSQKQKVQGEVADALAGAQLSQAQLAELCSAAPAKARGRATGKQAKPRKTPPVTSAEVAVKKPAKQGRGGKTAPMPAVATAAGKIEADTGNFRKFYDDDDSDSDDEKARCAEKKAVEGDRGGDEDGSDEMTDEEPSNVEQLAFDDEDDAIMAPRVGSKRKLSTSSSFSAASAFQAASSSRSESHSHHQNQSILPFGSFGTPLPSMPSAETAFHQTPFPRMSALHATSDNISASLPHAVATFGTFGHGAWVHSLPPQRAGSLLPGAFVSTASSNVVPVPHLPPSFMSPTRAAAAAAAGGANEPPRPMLNLTASRIAAQRDKFLRARGL